ncbi:MAG: uracil-DNA glycosylase [Candidatus Absconditicoccaceae bacterium]
MSTSVDINNVNIENSWKEVLKEEFSKPYFLQIKEFLLQEKNNGNIIYPEGKNIFNAFNQTPFDQVRVVILGQDPYHGEGEAHGLCFSVQDGVRQPPSLKNIFKEIESDLGISRPELGNLTKRTKQGILLVNAVLTVRKDTPASHKDIGRHTFTDEVIKKLSDKKNGLIFLLRGAFAQSKEGFIDSSKHIVLKAAHPSPFSVHRGFFGCKHFSKVNEILRNRGEKEIDRKLE